MVGLHSFTSTAGRDHPPAVAFVDESTDCPAAYLVTANVFERLPQARRARTDSFGTSCSSSSISRRGEWRSRGSRPSRTTGKSREVWGRGRTFGTLRGDRVRHPRLRGAWHAGPHRGGPHRHVLDLPRGGRDRGVRGRSAEQPSAGQAPDLGRIPYPRGDPGDRVGVRPHLGAQRASALRRPALDPPQRSRQSVPPSSSASRPRRGSPV